ncbi:hypothetical protein GCM10009582_34990 [Arthrobacter flavus]
MLALADELKARKVNLRVLNLGGGNVDTGTPMGPVVFTVMAALAQMELEIKRERVNDSNAKRRDAGLDLGGRRSIFSDSQIANARRLIEWVASNQLNRCSCRQPLIRPLTAGMGVAYCQWLGPR